MIELSVRIVGGEVGASNASRARSDSPSPREQI
jgi:hypothetical protein